MVPPLVHRSDLAFPAPPRLALHSQTPQLLRDELEGLRAEAEALQRREAEGAAAAAAAAADLAAERERRAAAEDAAATAAAAGIKSEAEARAYASRAQGAAASRSTRSAFVARAVGWAGGVCPARIAVSEAPLPSLLSSLCEPPPPHTHTPYPPGVVCLLVC